MRTYRFDNRSGLAIYSRPALPTEADRRLPLVPRNGGDETIVSLGSKVYVRIDGTDWSGKIVRFPEGFPTNFAFIRTELGDVRGEFLGEKLEGLPVFVS